MIKKSKRVDTLLPRDTRMLALKRCVRSFAIWFITRLGPFKTCAMVFSVILSVTLVQTLPFIQYAFAGKEISTGEYLSLVFGWCIMILVIALYQVYYLDHFLSLMVRGDNRCRN
jgi:hypothetical protein